MGILASDCNYSEIRVDEHVVTSSFCTQGVPLVHQYPRG